MKKEGFGGCMRKIFTNDLRMNTLYKYIMYHQDNKVIIMKEENDDALFIASIRTRITSFFCTLPAVPHVRKVIIAMIC